MLQAFDQLWVHELQSFSAQSKGLVQSSVGGFVNTCTVPSSSKKGTTGLFLFRRRTFAVCDLDFYSRSVPNFSLTLTLQKVEETRITANAS